jgi:hypothetical protein
MAVCRQTGRAFLAAERLREQGLTFGIATNEFPAAAKKIKFLDFGMDRRSSSILLTHLLDARVDGIVRISPQGRAYLSNMP